MLEQAQRQAADSEDLIGAKACIRCAAPVITVDHIEEAAPRLVPEPRPERLQARIEERLPRRIAVRADPKGI
jgi:hypothetical protein